MIAYLTEIIDQDELTTILMIFCRLVGFWNKIDYLSQIQGQKSVTSQYYIFQHNQKIIINQKLKLLNKGLWIILYYFLLKIIK